MNYFAAVLPLIIGAVLDSIFGDPYSLPHPVRLVGRLISQLESFVRRHMGGHLRAGGVLLALIVLIVSAVVPLGILILCYCVNIWLGAAAEGVMCYYLMAARCLRDESMKVYRAAAKGDTEGARKAVSMIVGRDTAVLDSKGIIKAAVETVAENTSDGVTAPIMYMSLGGAVLGAFYKAANTMDSMIGYKNEKYADIGRFAAKLDDVLNFIPSRLTALAMIVCAPMAGLDGRRAYRIWKRDRRKHASPNSGYPESALAGILDCRFGGTHTYFGQEFYKPYIGENPRSLTSDDARRAIRINILTQVLMLLITASGLFLF